MIVRRNVPTRVDLAKNRFSAITRPFSIRFHCDLLLTFPFFQLNTMMITMRAIHQLFTVKNVLATSDCCEIMCNVHDLYSYYSVSRQSLLISCYNYYYTINHNLTINFNFGTLIRVVLAQVLIFWIKSEFANAVHQISALPIGWTTPHAKACKMAFFFCKFTSNIFWERKFPTYT